MSNFADLGIPQSILKALTEAGYEQPTPVQVQAIPAAIAGNDLLVSAQTGSGKTAAFMLPVMSNLANREAELSIKQFSEGPKVLVLTPTRELALQVTKAVTLYGKYLKRFKVVSVVGGMPYHLQLKQFREPMEVLVATPGRLLDHVQNRKIDLSSVQTLVLDEADRMLDMGFIDDIMTIVKSLPETRQTLLFSATLDGVMADVAKKLTRQPQRIQIANVKDRHENIKQQLYYSDDRTHKDNLLQHWLRLPELKQAIVFAATKMDTEHLARHLVREGFAAAALHGDMQQRQRNRTLTDLHKGQLRVLVATDVAARGIDVAGISHVINYDLPMKAEDYVHRIGRTGRAGRSGIAISFVSIDDRRRVRAIEQLISQKIEVAQVPGLEPTKTMPERLSPNKRGKRGKPNATGRFEHSGRDRFDRAPRDHAPRDRFEHGSRDHAPRDHSSRERFEHGSRDHASRDHAPRERFNGGDDARFKSRPTNFQRDGLMRDQAAPRQQRADGQRDFNRGHSTRSEQDFGQQRSFRRGQDANPSAKRGDFGSDRFNDQGRRSSRDGQAQHRGQRQGGQQQGYAKPSFGGDAQRADSSRRQKPEQRHGGNRQELGGQAKRRVMQDW